MCCLCSVDFSFSQDIVTQWFMAWQSKHFSISNIYPFQLYLQLSVAVIAWLSSQPGKRSLCAISWWHCSKRSLCLSLFQAWHSCPLYSSLHTSFLPPPPPPFFLHLLLLSSSTKNSSTSFSFFHLLLPCFSSLLPRAVLRSLLGHCVKSGISRRPQSCKETNSD